MGQSSVFSLRTDSVIEYIHSLVSRDDPSEPAL